MSIRCARKCKTHFLVSSQRVERFEDKDDSLELCKCKLEDSNLKRIKCEREKQLARRT